MPDLRRRAARWPPTPLRPAGPASDDRCGGCQRTRSASQSRFGGDHLQHLDDRPVGSCHLEAALALPSEPDAELVEGLAGCEVTSVDLERIAQGPVHAVGLGASHPYRSIATAPLAFGSDLGRATNTNPRRLQLPKYIEPIAEDFVVDDHVIDDHIQPRTSGRCGRVVVCVQQASAGCADLQLRTSGGRLEPEPVVCVRARAGSKTQVQPCGRHLRKEVVDADQEPELASDRPLVSKRGRKRRLPGARRTIEDDQPSRRSHEPTVVLRLERVPATPCGRRGARTDCALSSDLAVSERGTVVATASRQREGRQRGSPPGGSTRRGRAR
jgi:hypothetical protein